MSNKSLSLSFLILAIGCFVVIVFFIISSFFLVKDAFTLLTVLWLLILGIIGITSFIASRSYAHQIRQDDNEKDHELPK